jgi:ATP-dependent Lhr-like helicase
LQQATEILLGQKDKSKGILIQSELKKKIEVVPILPEDVHDLSWGGHLGIKLLPKLKPILENGKITLVFTNTRAQSEIWYQQILEACPSLAGAMALHHGSLSTEIRQWVENALHHSQLQVVVCTSSLDLGVDFRHVAQIVQIGGPKGVARFMQRAGRSGHQPEATSTIYFLPTQTLELIECAALKTAIAEGKIEPKKPLIRAWDVLIQFCVTLAIGEGYNAEEIKKYEEELKSQNMTDAKRRTLVNMKKDVGKKKTQEQSKWFGAQTLRKEMHLSTPIKI